MVDSPQRHRDAALAVIGALLVAAALVLIWLARVSVPRELYVSELGALGEPTAEQFRFALLLLVAGGLLVAWSMRDLRSRPALLRRGTPALTLVLACSAFFVAAQVPCTPACPLPLGDTFTVQDLVHTLAAVIAFGAACWAMLQVAFAPGHRALSGITLLMALAVGVVAAMGGLLSLARWNAVFGSRLELVATTIGIGWLVVFGIVRAARLLTRPALTAAAAPDAA
ncbi:MAG: hypothetical protein B7Y93_02000 [Micrococcales bacterium 32-70-13]|nr:MAG: hypothetical protein B7Y93_02000 [Micrococcales bacterium 32-70-13]